MKKEKKFAIKVFVIIQNVDKEYDSDYLTFYINGFSKHHALFKFMGRNRLSDIVYEHNLKVQDLYLENYSFWEYDSISDYFFAELIYIKIV